MFGLLVQNLTMANEAVLRERHLDPTDFTVADGTAIAKGTLLKNTDPRTAAAQNGTADKLAGIAAREKVASDGRTQLSVYTSGIFDMYASGAITLGAPVGSDSSTYPNYVRELTTVQASGASILGYALETASNGEVFQVQVQLE